MAFVTEEKKESTIFIKNLPDDITTTQLESSLDEYGPVRRAIIVNDKKGVSRGFGYVEFVMPEDAEEAAKKLNHKEFFGKVVSVEVAKPKKRDKAETTKKEKKEKTPTMNDLKQEEITQRMHTIVVFGIPAQLSKATLEKKLNPIINSKKDEKELNTIDWPCESPFSDDQQKVNKPVARIHIQDDSMGKIKEIVKGINGLPGFFARRLSTIPSNRLNFEKCRMIVRNIPFNVSERKIYNLFCSHAPIHHITLPLQKGTLNKGYCFIQYYCNADVDTVIAAMNGYSWNDRVIVCDQSVNKYQYQKQLKEEEEEEMEEEEDEEKMEDEEKKEDSEEKMEEEPKPEEESESKEDHLKEVLGDADEGKTLFVRNIPMDSTEKDLFRFFRRHGTIEYVKLCKDKLTGLSKGTGFIKFKDIEDTEKLLAKYEAIATAFRETDKKKPKKEGKEEEYVDEEEKLIMNGRNLLLSRAITRKDLKKTLNERELAKKDNRNLYLLQEGFINEENRGTMNDRDLEKRKNSQKEKESKLKNPLFFVNPTRLLVKNIGPFITANYLKQICIYATKQAMSLELVQLGEVKLSLRPRSQTIPSDVQITQVVVPKDDNRGDSKSSKGFGFVEFKEHVHALCCLRYLNNNPAFAWAAFNVKTLVDLYKRCGESIEDNPHVLAKLNIEHLTEMKLPQRKGEISNSRLIVEFGISNHNVLKSHDLKKKKEKKVNALSVTQEGEKKELFDLSTKDRSRVKQRFNQKRSGKIRGDYDKQRKRR